MPRQFRTVDYEATLDSTVRLGDLLPDDHLAHFVADLVASLDLTGLYARYALRGGPPYAPEVLLGLLFYGYASGVFSSRRIEQATYDQAPFRFLAGNTHPDHDTLAHFRATFLDVLPDLFTQLLLLAQAAGVLRLGNISLDGTKIHADASKSKAVSYQRLLELETQLQAEVESLLARAGQADSSPLPDGLVLADEVGDREARLTRLAEAKAVLEARARERDAFEQAAYAAKVQERAERARRRGGKPGGRPPTPPTPGPRAADQYNFTDPDRRIMKNSRDSGFDQHYNGPVAVDQASRFIVGQSLSNHPVDVHEVGPTLESIPPAIGRPEAAALDNGYWSEANVAELESRGSAAHIATGRQEPRRSWREYFAPQEPPPLAKGATVREQMGHRLCTAAGRALYRLRKSTVEPVIGIIKETLGFRQFSLRGLGKVAGEWCLVCLAYNLKRYHRLRPCLS
jgi:transposase